MISYSACKKLEQSLPNHPTNLDARTIAKENPTVVELSAPHLFSDGIVLLRLPNACIYPLMNKKNLSSALDVLLEQTLVLLLLLDSLPRTVTELGRGIDPLERNLLESLAGGVLVH